MARGSLVGDAYVRIHADSDAMARELKRDAGLAGKKAGESAGANYTKSLAKLRKSELKAINQRLMKGVVGGKPEWDRQFKQSALASVDDFVDAAVQSFERLRKQAQKAGSSASVKEIERNLRDLDRWAQDARVEEALKRQIKLGEELSQETEKRLRKTRALQEALGRSIVKDMEKQERAARRLQEALGGSIVRDMKNNERAVRRFQEALGGSIVRDMKKMEKAVLDQDRAWQTYADNVGRKLPNALQRLAAAFDRDTSMKRYSDRVNTTIPRALLRLNQHLDRSESHFHRFSDTMGKVFGKGSRNDFFNFVGSIVGGVARIGTGLFHAGLRIAGFGATFAHVIGTGLVDTVKGIGSLFSGGGFGDIGGALKGVGKGIGDLALEIGVTLAGGLKAAIPLVIAIVAAFTVMQIVIFPLIALVANLAGAIFILASEIAIALAGGLLALAPAALALAGGIGTAILMVINLKNESKKTAKAMKPLSDAWAGLQKTVKGVPLQEFAEALGNLGPIVKKVITPLVVGFSSALSIITNTFAALFTGPRIQPALKNFIETLPDIFTNFGQGLAELSAGLIQFFDPILPFAEKLSENFEKLMTQFNDWASSAEGKNSIKEFMDKAWEAANDLWDIIGLVGEALGGLIEIATPSGDSKGNTTILDSIKGGLQSIVDFINSPEGKKAIQDFFTNARTTASELGDSIGEISTALSTVDWKAASETANSFLRVISQITAGFIILGSDMPIHTKLMSIAFSVFGDTLRAIYNTVIGPVFDKILGAIAGILQGMADFLEVVAKVPGMGWAQGLADNLRESAAQVDALGDAMREIPDAHATVFVSVAGEGARLLRGASAGNTVARNRLNTVFGAAAGGILTAPTFIRSNVVAGEAGREAIVPLDRPLALVDPSVRDLAAFAQGLPTRRMASGGMLGGGVTIAPGAIAVYSVNADPAQVAEAVVDRIVVNVR